MKVLVGIFMAFLLLFCILLFSTPALTEILFSSLIADSLIVTAPADTFVMSQSQKTYIIYYCS